LRQFGSNLGDPIAGFGRFGGQACLECRPARFAAREL